MQERRTTKQQAAIKATFQSANGPLSIDELLQAAQARVPSLGQRTVYRVVRRLEEDGELVRVFLPDQPIRYELASVAAHHHHHFHCVECDRAFDLEGCTAAFEKLLPEGFVMQHHDLTLAGLCADCTPNS